MASQENNFIYECKVNLLTEVRLLRCKTFIPFFTSHSSSRYKDEFEEFAFEISVKSFQHF